jgi:uncharacterized membrane protein
MDSDRRPFDLSSAGRWVCSSPKGMPEFLTSPLAWVVVLFAAMGMMIAVGVYLASRFRGTEEDGRLGANELLSKFREMHSQGELSDAEYRTIRAKLEAAFQHESRDSDRPG